MRLALPAAIAASLAFAAPALAQAPATPGTVGPGQVITDPAAQVDDPAPVTVTPGHLDTQQPPPRSEPTADAGQQQPEAPGGTPPPLHVTRDLIGERHASGTTASGTAASSPGAQAPAATAAPAASTAPASQPVASSRRQLPFTGIAAWQIAVLGFALLAAGAGLWRVGETRL